jgi:hypothetical protein
VEARSGRMLRRCDRALAASGITITGVAAACGPKPCPVQLSDLAAGTDIQVAVPQRAWADRGVFSPDGRYRVLVFGGVDAVGAVTPARVGVIDVAARRLLAVPGAVMGDGDVGLAVGWSPDDPAAGVGPRRPADRAARRLAARRHRPARAQAATSDRPAPGTGRPAAQRNDPRRGLTVNPFYWNR